MTQVITLCNLKGGTGKTTTAMLLGIALNRQGHTVEILDADPQGSATNWAAEAEDSGHRLPMNVTPANPTSLRRHSTAADYVIIDCPTGIVNVVDAAIHAADHVIIPVSPSPMEVERMWDTWDLATEYDARILINNARHTKSLEQLQEALEDNNIARFTPIIFKREAITKMFGTCPESSLYGFDDVAAELIGGK